METSRDSAASEDSGEISVGPKGPCLSSRDNILSTAASDRYHWNQREQASRVSVKNFQKLLSTTASQPESKYDIENSENLELSNLRLTKNFTPSTKLKNLTFESETEFHSKTLNEKDAKCNQGYSITHKSHTRTEKSPYEICNQSLYMKVNQSLKGVDNGETREKRFKSLERNGTKLSKIKSENSLKKPSGRHHFFKPKAFEKSNEKRGFVSPYLCLD